jgi:hypothetical protein
MKITTFNPQIVTKNQDEVVQLFEELGFEKTHTLEAFEDKVIKGIRMKDANGFYLDVSKAEAAPPQDLVFIRMNVDNFDEAYEILVARGFKNFYGDDTVKTSSAKSAIMISPSGFAFNLIEHKHH